LSLNNSSEIVSTSHVLPFRDRIIKQLSIFAIDGCLVKLMDTLIRN